MCDKRIFPASPPPPPLLFLSKYTRIINGSAWRDIKICVFNNSSPSISSQRVRTFYATYSDWGQIPRSGRGHKVTKGDLEYWGKLLLLVKSYFLVSMSSTCSFCSDLDPSHSFSWWGAWCRKITSGKLTVRDDIASWMWISARYEGRFCLIEWGRRRGRLAVWNCRDMIFFRRIFRGLQSCYNQFSFLNWIVEPHARPPSCIDSMFAADKYWGWGNGMDVVGVTMFDRKVGLPGDLLWSLFIYLFLLHWYIIIGLMFTQSFCWRECCHLLELFTRHHQVV